MACAAGRGANLLCIALHPDESYQRSANFVLNFTRIFADIIHMVPSLPRVCLSTQLLTLRTSTTMLSTSSPMSSTIAT